MHTNQFTSRALPLASLALISLVACQSGAGNESSFSTNDSTTSEDEAGEDTGGEDCGTPGTTEPCYSGPEGTQDVGICSSGERECQADGTWTQCAGELLPEQEVCANELDDNCDGQVDEDVDADGDGFSGCNADCCDVAADQCSDPELVNPGAYEVQGNNVDDDCDGIIDEPEDGGCDTGLQTNSLNAEDYARALDLCQFTTENPPNPQDRVWGVLDAKLTLANGTGTPAPESHAIRPTWGDALPAELGDSLVIFSSGHAAAPGDQDPGHVPFEQGANLGTSSPAPQDWLAANGGKYPNPAGCPDPDDFTANDAVMLTLTVRVPTNAQSFSMRMNFYSAEYPEFVCTRFNDFFVTLLDSNSPSNPEDKNIAVYDDDGTKWPVGVNLVKVADGLFTSCSNGEVGCACTQPGCDEPSQYTGCEGPELMAGTGMDTSDNYPGGNLVMGCGDVQEMGGGTGWLTMVGAVEPGETIDLRFAIWDSGGHIYDAVVLLDAFEWSIDAANPGVRPG